MPKRTIIAYARQHHLTWHEDSTNQDTTYLRNDLRARISRQLSDDEALQLRALWQTQLQLKRDIDQETEKLLAGSDHNYSRHFFTSIDTKSALELLRAVCQREIGLSPTIPQRERALHAIKTLQPGKVCEVGEGIRLTCRLRTFSIQKS
jgi:tRNA(Ile)-lysidine synthase TilS/MesJ